MGRIVVFNSHWGLGWTGLEVSTQSMNDNYIAENRPSSPPVLSNAVKDAQQPFWTPGAHDHLGQMDNTYYPVHFTQYGTSALDPSDRPAGDIVCLHHLGSRGFVQPLQATPLSCS